MALKWEGGPESFNPTCGLCTASGSPSGWSFNPETEYWVCGACRKPSPCNLRECEYCELVYLPRHHSLLKYTLPGSFTLDHRSCIDQFA